MNQPLINFVTRLLNHSQTTVEVNSNTIVDGFSLVNKELNFRLNIFSDKYNSIYFELHSFWERQKTVLKWQPNYRLDDFKEFKSLLNTISEKLDSQPFEEKEISQYVKLWKQVLKGEQLPDGFILEENSYAFYLKKDGYQLSTMEKKSIVGSLNRHSSSGQEPLCLLRIPFLITQNKPSYFNFPVFIPKYDAENYLLLNSSYNFSHPLGKVPSAKYKRHNHLSTSLEDWINKLMVNQDIKNSEFFNLLHYEHLSLSLNTNNETKTKKIKL